MASFPPVAAFVHALALISCAEASPATAALPTSGGTQARTAPAAAPSAASANLLRLCTATIHDAGIGCTAATLLVPEGWELEGGVHWQMEYSNLATGKMTVRDKSSFAALEVFPVIPACWDDSGSVGFIGPGQNYMGNVVHPCPRDALQYVREVFVPLYRREARGIKVGAATPLPDVARAVERNVRDASLTQHVTSARVRLEWIDREKPIEEDVFITLVSSRSPLVPTMTIWSLEHQYSFRAEKGKLVAVEPLLQSIVSSLRPDVRWYAGYAEVLELWRRGQMQSIRDAGELSRRISRNNDEILASMRASYEERQRSQDRVHREFSEYVRDVETYDHPYEGREIELPSSYRDVWTNAQGEYVFSNTDGYDPNVGSTTEWRRMQPAR